MRAKRGKLYCEKVMVVGVDQVTLMHFHWDKVEDIINRGAGKLGIQLYNATNGGGVANTAVVASLDGLKRQSPTYFVSVLKPGSPL